MNTTAAPTAPATAPAARHRRRRRAGVAALLVAVALVATGCLDTIAHNHINTSRRTAGVRELPRHAWLDGVAQAHAQKMANECRTYHSSPALWLMPGYSAGAENVGAGPTVDAVHTAFMRSPQHRGNILNAAHKVSGVGVVERPECGGNKVFVVHLFNG